MRKGAFALVGLVVLALVAMHLAEKKVEDLVAQGLQDAKISAEKIDFGLLSQRLTLENLVWNDEADGSRNSVKARLVEIEKPDQEALSRFLTLAASGENAAVSAGAPAPLVARSITVHDLEQVTEEDDPRLGRLRAESRSRRLVLEGWRQDLAAVLANWRQESWSQAFFQAVLNGAFDHLSQSDVESAFTASGQSLSWRIASQESVWQGNRLSWRAEGLTLAGKTEAGSPALLSDDLALPSSLEGSLQSLSCTDLLLPSPDLMLTLREAAEAGEAVPPALESRLEKQMQAYFAATPYKALRAEGLVLRGSDQASGAQEEIRIGLLENELSFQAPYRFAFSLQNAALPGLDALILNALELPPSDLGSTEASARLSVDLPDLSGNGSLDLDMSVSGLGALSGNTVFALPEGANIQLDDLDEDSLMGLSLGKTSLRYRDDGLLARVFEIGARETGQSPESLIAAARQEIESELGSLPVPGLVEALRVMLERPGVLAASLDPGQPLPLSAMAITLMFNPASLGLSVSAEAGQKSLVDSIVR